MVLVRAVAIFDARLAGRDAGIEAVLSNRRLVTRFDIIFFWVARMMMMGLHFIRKFPFVTSTFTPSCATRRARRCRSRRETSSTRSTHRSLRRRCAALHLGGDGGAGTRHQAQRGARRRLPQFRDQAVERLSLRRDNGCVRVEGFDPLAVREPLNRWISAKRPRLRRRRRERSNPIGSTTQPARLIASSGACSATGASNSRSPCCRRLRTGRPSPRLRRQSPMCSTRSTQFRILSCRSSPKSCGRIGGNPGPSARVRSRSGHGLGKASKSMRRSRPKSAGSSTLSPAFAQ